jgi:hypothetical protein
MQAGSTCPTVGATCSIFLGAAGCGGECVCQPDQEWLCEISCSPIITREASTPVGVADASVATPEAAPAVADAGVVDASVLPEDAGMCCGDSQNTDFPPSDTCGGASIAWEYIPKCDIPVALIQLHNGGGPVAILDSEGTAPGKLLWSGTLPATSSPAWLSTEVYPPVPLYAGHRYFLFEGEGPCSIAASGDEQPYYAGSPSGTWSGPYMGHAWTARLGAACE